MDGVNLTNCFGVLFFFTFSNFFLKENESYADLCAETSGVKAQHF